MKKFFLILIILVYISFDTMAQFTLKLENGEDKELVGLSRVYHNDGRMAFGIVKGGKAELIADISQKTLLVMGYQGEVYFLLGEPGGKYVFDCKTKEVLGGNGKVRAFIDAWTENYFDIPENTLRDRMLFLTSQNTSKYIEKGEPINDKKFLEPEFLPEMKQWQKNQIKMLKKFKYKDKEFKTIFSEFLYLNYWERLVRTLDYIYSSGNEIPGILLDEVLNIDVDKPNFTESDYASRWLDAYIRALESKGMIKPTLKDYVFKTATYFQNPRIQEFYVLRELERKILYNNLVFFEELFLPTSSCVVSTEGKEKFQRLFDKGKYALIEHNRLNGVVKEIDFITSNGKKCSLSDYAGKYIYIDFWATWCVPCKQETPHFLKLAERMKDKEIVFLSLSVDNKRSKKVWEEYVKEHNLQRHCVAGWVEKGLKHPFTVNYGVVSIPRFMLVGPDGKMIYSDCWRPSSVHIDKLLNSFLN